MPCAVRPFSVWFFRLAVLLSALAAGCPRAAAQTRIKDLPLATTTTTNGRVALDDATYGLKGISLLTLASTLNSVAATNGLTTTNALLYAPNVWGTVIVTNGSLTFDGIPGGGGGTWPRSFSLQNFDYVQNSQANHVAWYGVKDASLSGGNLYLTTYTNLYFNTPEIASFSLSTNAVPVLTDPTTGQVKFVPLESLQLGTTVTSGKIIGKHSTTKSIVSGTVDVTDVASATTTAAATAARVRQVATVAAAQALTGLANNDIIQIAGRTTAGDGGGSTVYYSSSSTSTTNLGTIFTATGMGTGRLLWNGVGNLNPQMFGTVNDGSTDDTAAFQAFVDYVSNSRTTYTNYGQWSSVIPDGVYSLSSITNATAMQFVSSSGEAAGDFTPFRGVIFMQRANANAPMFVIQIPEGVPAGNRGSPIFKGITFYGRSPQNLRGAKAIVSSTTRTNLVVGVGNLPPDPYVAGLTSSFSKVGNLVTGLNWPYFGFASIRTSQGITLGNAVIYSIDYGTGAVVIYPDWDKYETITANAGLLAAGDQICFASIQTESAAFLSGSTNYTGIEAGSAGYAAVHIESKAGQTGSGVSFENCSFRNFHTGVRVGDVLNTKFTNCRFNVMDFAAISSAFPGDSRDGKLDKVFTYGGFSQNAYSTTETNSVTASGAYANSFRNQLFGVYGLEASGIIRGLVINNTVCGTFGHSLTDTHIDDILVEATLGSGMLFDTQTTYQQGLGINSLMFRNFTGTPSAAATNRTRNGIYILPATVNSNMRINVSRLSLEDFTNTGSNPWTTGLAMRSTDFIHVSRVTMTNGVTTLDNATGTITYGVAQTYGGNVTVAGTVAAGTVTSGGAVTATGAVSGSDLNLASTSPILTATANNGSSGLRLNVLGGSASTVRFQTNGTTTHTFNGDGSATFTGGLTTTAVTSSGPVSGTTITGSGVVSGTDLNLTGTAPALTATANNGSSGLRLNVLGGTTALLRIQTNSTTTHTFSGDGSATFTGGLTTTAVTASGAVNAGTLAVGATGSGNVATFTGGSGGVSIMQFVRSGFNTLGFRNTGGFYAYDETAGKGIYRAEWTGSNPRMTIGNTANASPVDAYLTGEIAIGSNIAGNDLWIHSGQGTGNASTASSWIRLATPTAGASSSTLQTMTERVRITDDKAASTTALWLDVNGTFYQVTIGAADSAGAGYRQLRIVN